MKKFSLVLLGIVMSFLLISCGSTTDIPSEPSVSPEVDENASAFELSDGVLENLEQIDSQITSVMISKGYVMEHASFIQEVLNTVGIESIDIENMTGKAEEGLNSIVCYPNGYTDRDRRFFFTTDNGIIFYAGFSDEDLYDNGTYLKNYGDVHVSEKKITLDVYSEIQELATQYVESCLNYPNSADFGAFDWAAGRSDDKYMVVGKVEAKNGFGVKEKIPFTVWLRAENESYVLEGVALNGVRVK